VGGEQVFRSGLEIEVAQNKLSEVMPWDLVADGYVEETMPVFKKWAQDAICRVQPQKDHAVIDIATGPGTVALLVAALVREVVAVDFSRNMVGHLRKAIQAQGMENIVAEVCDGQALPYEEGRFDCAFSQFGLMFFPDRVKGFREMHRVLKPGGKAAVYSWAPLKESPAMTMMMSALAAGFPEVAPKETEAKTIVFGLDNLDVFRAEMTQAGFRDVTFESIEHAYPRFDAAGFWKRMHRGSAPVTAMRKATDPKTWAERERVCIAYLEKNMPAVPLTSKAYLGMGVK
jgi:ubiquinone/menaquinone biosynthesis C-methylase UbiE